MKPIIENFQPFDTLHIHNLMNNFIFSADTKKSCAETVCQLDLALTQTLVQLEDLWNSNFHIENGFDKSLECISQNTNPAPRSFLPRPGKAEKSSPSNDKKPLKFCCGEGKN